MDSPSIETIAVLAGGTLVGALCAAMSEALNSKSDAQWSAFAAGADWRAVLADRVIRDKAGIRTRLLTGQMLGFASALGATAWMTHESGFWVTIAAALSVAFLNASVAEVFSSAARQREIFGLKLLRWFRWLEYAFWPTALPLQFVGRAMSLAVPERESQDSERMTELVVEHMIEQGEESGSIPEDHAELLLRVLEFKNTVAREVMVPRTQVVAIELHTPIESAIDAIVESGHSRYPVYRERMDQIEGVLYAKDLFKLIRERGEVGDIRLGQIIRRPAYFALESEKIGSLLREMQSRNVHLAVVVDEFGGTSGILTLEDILEEIVGEIRDEHDEEEARVEQLGDGRYQADGAISVYDLADVLGQPIKQGEGDYDTLGGLVVEVAGRVPEVGESLRVGDFDLRVVDADDRRVSRVEITRAETIPAPES